MFSVDKKVEVLNTVLFMFSGVCQKVIVLISVCSVYSVDKKVEIL